jgi:hypothetical protein
MEGKCILLEPSFDRGVCRNDTNVLVSSGEPASQ